MVVRSEEFEEYASALNELVVNSKPIISSLTMLAGEIAGKDEARASVIADLIRTHIKNSPVKSKLCGFYLLDSVVKNIRGPFVRIFGKGLSDLFLPAYAKVTDAQKKSMMHLFGTWKTVFPASVLDEIEPYLTPSALAGMQPPMAPTGALYMAAPPAQQWQMPAQQQWAPPAQQWAGYPAAVPLLQQPYAAYGIAPTQLVASVPPPPPVLAGAAGGQLLANMLQGGSGGDLSALIASLEAKQGANMHLIAAPQMNAQPGELPALTADFDPKTDLGELSKRRESVIRTLYFERPIQCSQTGRRFRSQSELDAHMDWLHARRRRRREGKVCRKWFVDLKSWLKGLKTMAEETVNFFGGSDESKADVDANAAQEEELANVSVPVDESQPACALSGEQFETFWNEKEQEWHYRGAIVLDRAIGGAKKGSIVLARAVPKKAVRAAKATKAIAADVKTEPSPPAGRRSARAVKTKVEAPAESTSPSKRRRA